VSPQNTSVNGNPKASGGIVLTTGGGVIAHDTMTILTNLPVVGQGLVEPDTAAQRLFFLEEPTGLQVRVFDSRTYANLANILVGAPVWPQHSLVRCGGDRIAIGGSGGNTIIIRTALIDATDLIARFSPQTRPFVAGHDQAVAVEIRNAGPKPVTNAVLTVTFPSIATIVSANLSQGTAVIDGHQITMETAGLASNSTAVLTAVLRFTNTLTIVVTNTATVSSTVPELFPDDNSVTAIFRVSADIDADGLGDDWESEFFGSLSAPNGGPDDDYDGDGMTNLQEFLSGTNPADTANAVHITAVSVQAGTVYVQFHAVNGGRYQLFSATTVNGMWTPLGTPVIGQGHFMTVQDPIALFSRYYRVARLP
jgi:hypothetical protein